MFIVKRFLKPHKRPKQFWKFEFKIQNRNLFLMITPLTARFQINIILIGIIKLEHWCWWRMLVTTGADDNGSQLKNLDISGFIFKLSLIILILNSQCVEGARDVRVLLLAPISLVTSENCHQNHDVTNIISARFQIMTLSYSPKIKLILKSNWTYIFWHV